MGIKWGPQKQKTYQQQKRNEGLYPIKIIQTINLDLHLNNKSFHPENK